MQWPGTELLMDRRFADVPQGAIERRTEMSARDDLGHLSTISACSRRGVTLVADLTLRLARLAGLEHRAPLER